MPSAFSLPCQTGVHWAPASMIPGMAVIVTSFGGGGTRKVLWAFPCWIRDRNRAATGRSRKIEDILMLYRLPCTGWGDGTDAALRIGALAELLSVRLEQ